MRIAVLGTFILDEIHTIDNRTTFSLGGITYAVSALANLLSDQDTIVPIANIGEDGRAQITSFISQYPNISPQSIAVTQQFNTRVLLQYYSKHERIETLSNLSTPISIDQLNFREQFDVILINYITGFEMSIETHRYITEKAPLIYMDYHSLTLGIDEQGQRFKRKPENWEQWLYGINILQLNEHEAALLGGSEAPFETVVRTGFNSAIDLINITTGEHGSNLYQANSQDCEIPTIIPAQSFGDPVDVTGCGDAFAGGFISALSRGDDPVSAAQYANQVAGFASTITGIEGMKELSRFKYKN